jgi:hypothetical protein
MSQTMSQTKRAGPTGIFCGGGYSANHLDITPWLAGLVQGMQNASGQLMGRTPRHRRADVSAGGIPRERGPHLGGRSRGSRPSAKRPGWCVLGR